MNIKLSVFFTIVAVITYYFSKSHVFYFVNKLVKGAVDKQFFTSDELKQYNGVDRPELFLCILGNVYDVSKGAVHYGPGKSYNIFIGKDSSRSFVSGKFEENQASDEVSDLSQQELRSLNHWIKFYNKEYVKIGKLIGRYYNDNGKPTPYAKIVKKLIKDAEKAKDNEDMQKIKFPPCNVEWDAHRGTHVWCTKRSGGITRDWIGVPRQLYEPGSQNYRCACIHEDYEEMANLKQYDNCDSASQSCFIGNKNN